MMALYHQNTTLLYPNHRITSFSARAKSNAPPTPHGPRGDPSNPRSISFTLLDTNASCARCLASRVCSTVVAIDDSVASSALGSPATAGACACIDPPGSSRCRNACRKTAAARFLFSARTARLRAFSERVVLGGVPGAAGVSAPSVASAGAFVSCFVVAATGIAAAAGAASSTVDTEMSSRRQSFASRAA